MRRWSLCARSGLHSELGRQRTPASSEVSIGVLLAISSPSFRSILRRLTLRSHEAAYACGTLWLLWAGRCVKRAPMETVLYPNLNAPLDMKLYPLAHLYLFANTLFSMNAASFASSLLQRMGSQLLKNVLTVLENYLCLSTWLTWQLDSQNRANQTTVDRYCHMKFFVAGVLVSWLKMQYRYDYVISFVNTLRQIVPYAGLVCELVMW